MDSFSRKVSASEARNRRREERRRDGERHLNTHAMDIIATAGSEEVSPLKKSFLLSLAMSTYQGSQLRPIHLQLYFQNANEHDIQYFSEIIALSPDAQSTQDFIWEFLQRNNLPVEMLPQMLQEQSKGSRRFESWGSKRFNAAQLLEVWLEKEGNNLDYAKLNEILVLEENDEVKQEALGYWLKKPENNLTFDQLLSNLSASPFSRSLALSWIESCKELISFEDLTKILANVGLSKEIIAKFLSNNDCSADQLVGLLDRYTQAFSGRRVDNMMQDSYEIIISWAQKHKLSADDVRKFIPHIPLFLKESFCMRWLKEDKNNRFEDAFNILSQALSDVGLREGVSQLNFLTTYLADCFTSGKEESPSKGNALEKKQFIDTRLIPLIAQLGGDVAPILMIYFSSDPANNISLEALKKSFSQCYLGEDDLLAVSEWIRRNPQITLKEFNEILRFHGQEEYKAQITLQYLSLLDPQQKYDALVQIAKSNPKFYKDPKFLAAILSQLSDIGQVTEFSRAVYPNAENERYEFASSFLFFPAEYVARNIVALKKLAVSFKEENATHRLLKAISTKLQAVERSRRVILPESFVLAQDVSLPRYELLQDLMSKKIKDCVNEEALLFLKKTFSHIDIETQSLGSLFYCYELRDELKIFFRLLNPKTAEEVKDRVHFVKFDHYLNLDQYENICTNWAGNPPPGHDLDVGFPTIGQISTYLAPKANIAPLTRAEIDKYQINFSGEVSTLFAELEKQEINEEFRRFLKEKVSDGDVLSLFAKLFRVDFTQFTNEEKGRFVGFCHGRPEQKTLLAHLFQQPDVLLNFAAAFAKDGCSYNITNQARILLYKCLLKDPRDQILLSYFHNLFQELTRVFGGDLIGTQANPFANTASNGYHLCPIVVFEEMKKEFYDPTLKTDKINRNAWDFLASLNLVDVSDKEIAAQVKSGAAIRAQTRASERVEARANSRARIRDEAIQQKESAGESIDYDQERRNAEAAEALATMAETRGDFKEQDAADEAAHLALESTSEAKAKFKAAAKASIVRDKFFGIWMDVPDMDIDAAAAKMSTYLVLKHTLPNLLKSPGLQAVAEECEKDLAEVKKKVRPQVQEAGPSAASGKSSAQKVTAGRKTGNNPTSAACIVM